MPLPAASCQHDSAGKMPSPSLWPMRVVWKVLRGILVFVVVAAVVIVGAGAIVARRSFPQTSGQVEVDGLAASVTVIRDGRGVPHIYAESTGDLYFAQGYVHAQDRFWQMDWWRHIGSARLAELAGSALVDTDTFLRTLGFADIAEREIAQLDSESQAALEAYAAGVNAYLNERSGSALSFEYAMLPLLNRGYEPEPWTPVNTITWAKMMAWDLGGNMGREIERAVTYGLFGADRAEELWPEFPSEFPVIVPDSFSADATPGPADTDLVESLAPLWVALGSDLDALSALGPFGQPDIGSNNWVVSGTRTNTGMPLLANDPHLGIQNPAIWYEAGLHCTGTSGRCPHDVVGFSLPGTPGIVIGHNDRIAWGVTNLGPDVQDLFIEKINPENPDQYEFEGEWVDMDIRTEIIEVAGSDAITLEVKSTIHGPIISDVYGPLEDFGDKAGGTEVPDQYAVAFRWTALEPTGIVDAILGVNYARDWDDFRNALRDWDVPSQNFVYADVEGNIGYQAPGQVPIRVRGDGRLPVPGWTGEHEWAGFVPFSQLPSVYNPPEGFIATANQPVIEPGSVPYLGADAAYGYRGARIVDVLEADSDVTIDEISELQGDARNLSAEEILPYVFDLPADSEVVEDAQQMLLTWSAGDAAFQMNRDSAGAALYGAFWRNLLRTTFHDELPERYYPNGQGRWFVVVESLLADPTASWWDDTTTTGVEDRDIILVRALSDAWAELEDELGRNPDNWRWGDLHTAEFQNAPFGQSGIAPLEWIFNRGGFEVDGGRSIVNATGWSPVDGYEVVTLPSMRMIVDMADFDRSLTIHTTGQSGHTFHPHYMDLAPLWANEELLPMHWTRDAVESDSTGILILRP